jgi:hypothetical protein
MCKAKGITKTGNSGGGMEKRGGYTPISEGYTPDKKMNCGYTPSVPEKGALPQPPAGGSGEKKK